MNSMLEPQCQCDGILRMNSWKGPLPEKERSHCMYLGALPKLHQPSPEKRHRQDRSIYIKYFIPVWDRELWKNHKWQSYLINWRVCQLQGVLCSNSKLITHGPRMCNGPLSAMISNYMQLLCSEGINLPTEQNSPFQKQAWPTAAACHHTSFSQCKNSSQEVPLEAK